jgi:predicted HAD superfamily hydrolase
MIHSFDVFDTCITRVHAHPRDLFFQLGWELAPSNISSAARCAFAHRFQRRRVLAEKIANWRARSARQQADIFAIYSNFRWLMRTGLTVPELVEAEVELETDSVYPVTEILDRINAIRKSGERILFISDMYIPARLLGPMLSKHGLLQEGDALYVSCDVGASKHSGKLFEHVLRSEDVAAEQVTHTGDNLHADIHMSQRIGIKATHFTSAQLSQRELEISKIGMPTSPSKSWLAGFSRRVRLTSCTPTQTTQVLDEIIHGTVVPFLLAFVLWLLKDAKQRGITRLYFVARDGEVLYKIAKELAPIDIEIRYLHGSRRAWLAPSITLDNTDWIRLLVVPGDASARSDIISRIGIEGDAQEKLRGILGFSHNAWRQPLSLDAATRFTAELFCNSSVADLIADSILPKREAALAYFEQEGLFDKVSWALVDAGWSLNSQSALKRILAKHPLSHQVPRGYYLGLAKDHLDVSQAGHAYAFTEPAGALLSRRRVIIEHCFLPATHPSTKGYQVTNGCLRPAFGGEVRAAPELAYARHLHSVAVQAAKVAANQENIRVLLGEHTPEIVANATSLIRRPSARDASAMSSFGTIADLRQESAFVRPLCKKLGLKDVWTTLTIALSRQKGFATPAYMWLEGSIALSSKIVRLPLNLMLWLYDLRNNFGSDR